MGSKKKKKRSGSQRNKGRAPSKDHTSQVSENNDVSEEITALCGIFQEDCMIVSDSPPQIDVKLRPYSKDTGFDDLDISAILSIRYLPGYPHKCPKLQINPERGLSRTDADKLLSLLHDQANSNAREGRVMIYNLVEAAREFISEIHPASQSLKTVKFVDEDKDSSKLDLAIANSGGSLPNVPFVYGFIDLFSGLGELWNWGLEIEDTKYSSIPYSLDQNVNQMVIHDNKQVQPDTTKEKLHTLEERGEDDVNNMSPADLNLSSSAESTESVYSDEAEELEPLFESDDDQLDRENEKSVSSASVSDQLSHPIETDLFLAHLLRLTCASKGLEPDVTSELCNLGIISESVRDLANKPPTLFDKTFDQVFAGRMVSSEISKFWKTASGIGGDDSTSLPASRYLNDFEELQPIGQGGFGHVLLCKNKLDGRQYAVKKIRLKDKSLPVNDRILREVATLSRLQHLHVVRYYQAWFEAGFGGPISEAISGSRTMMSSSFSFKETSSAGPDNKMESTYLYIQMEYCPRTLRQMFESYSSHFEKDMAWHLFRQIVEGLSHIHGQGIIHRDLTPNNIFFDARNDIKIGDFGLAKFLQREQLDQDSDPVEPTPVSVDRTGQVGTYFYTAPEIEQGWPKIDEKADMYSLGIVFFELWHPFGTAMERHVLLSDLKLKGEPPSNWVSEFPEQASLLKRLMSSSPSNRPSANELIQHAFPPRMEYQLLDNILRTMHISEDKTFYDKIVNAVFDQPSCYVPSTDDNVGYDDSEAEVRDSVVDLTVDVFRRYCAKHFEIAPVTLLSNNHNRNAVKLLTRDGNMTELCQELRLPFAKWIVAKQRSSFKRYEISHVYRKSIGFSPPNRYLQGDFDIIGGQSSLTEAETIKATMDIVTRCFESESCEIHLNHGKLLEAIWSWIGVKPGHRQKVAELLSLLSSLRPQSPERKSKRVVIRRQLRQELNLSEATVNRLQTVESRFCEYADQALPRLRGALPSDKPIRKALDELTELFNYLRRWKIDKHVFIDALMPPSESYHRHIYFQIYLRNDSEGTMLAIGGRYDYLLKQMWNRAHKSKPPGAVGVSIALETIIRHLDVKSRRHDHGIISVLVCSRGGGGLLEERMELVAELWEEGIRAQLVSVSDPSFTEQYEYANEHGIKCLVIITEVGVSQGSVKVRHLDLKKERDVSKENLIKFLFEATETQFRNPSIWN
ncbi:eIF-2-alpha kinase GCN2 [Impatiens glandulifera]|uniref:eIF-2-alpha kinase GCN2 n=1 Tax=Impatiens glandulifera TaxID=253017 RepID=UPI001FB1263C|nr:eIF-2-alpha kinase GCN2 [Impatiens glandulifera]